MIFQYDTVENEIVDRLSTLSDVAAVAPLPENEKELKDLVDAAINNDKCMILVAYTGSDFGTPEVLNPIRQNEDVKMLLNVQGNRLRGNTGIYNVLSLIKERLQGYQIQAYGGRLKLKTVDFDNRDEKMALFSYNVIFNFSKVQAQKYADGEDNTDDLPRLNQTNFTNGN